MGENSCLDGTDSSNIQVKFITKQEKFSIPDTTFFVSGNSKRNQLSNLVKRVLSENEGNGDHEDENVQFDFIIQGELLRTSLQEHLQEKAISCELVIEIEYFIGHPAPKPQECLQHDDWVSAVQASCRWIITGCYDNTIHLWSLAGEHKLTIPGHLGPVKAVAWVSNDTPVCSFISTSHDGTSIIWHWNEVNNSVECASVCRGHGRSVDCIAVKEGGQQFATGSFDKLLKIWSTDSNSTDTDANDKDEESRKRLKTENGKAKAKTSQMTLSGHNEAVTGVQWTGEYELCSVSMDNTIRLWDVELGGMKVQLNGSKSFLGLSYSPLNKLVITACTDRHVRLWDPRVKEGSLVMGAFTSHSGWVSDVKWSPLDEFKFISGSYDHIMKLWDTRSPKAPLYDMTGHDDKILCVDWTEPSLMLSGSSDNMLKIFSSEC